MAPESERAKIQDFCHQERFSSATCSRGTTGCEVKHPKPNEPTLTCSEVVERLDKECFLSANPNPVATISLGVFDRKKALAILHSWRERRVQELEELLAKHSLTPEIPSTQLDTTKEKV